MRRLLRRHPLEEEARELRELSQRRNLLLHERRHSANEVLVPVVALLTQVGDEAVRIFGWWQRPQVDAVHMRQLLVVERGGALADSLEREALDQLLAAHQLGVVVVAPAQEREVVDEGLWDEPGGAELLDGDGAMTLRERLSVGAV